MRCTPVSEGCKNCWHLMMACRLAANPMIPNLEARAFAGEEPVLYRNQLDAPLRLRKPARIGVQFMGDLFHEAVPRKFIDQIIGVIAGARQHIFMILTKRPENIDFSFWKGCSDWPLKNLWLGVSVENQKTADERIPLLLQTPAAVRFVSYEPAIGHVSFHKYLRAFDEDNPPGWGGFYSELDWIIMGCETGSGARPMHPDWARSVRDQCKAAGVPFWFKSWGRGIPPGHIEFIDGNIKDSYIAGKEYKELPNVDIVRT